METWAKVGTDDIVLTVEVASVEWVNEWRESNPDSLMRWVATDPNSPGYAGIGFSLDEETMRFIPPRPEGPGDWEFDRETWLWVDRDVPAPDPDTPTE